MKETLSTKEVVKIFEETGYKYRKTFATKLGLHPTYFSQMMTTMDYVTPKIAGLVCSVFEGEARKVLPKKRVEKIISNTISPLKGNNGEGDYLATRDLKKALDEEMGLTLSLVTVKELAKIARRKV